MSREPAFLSFIESTLANVKATEQKLDSKWFVESLEVLVVMRSVNEDSFLHPLRNANLSMIVR